MENKILFWCLFVLLVTTSVTLIISTRKYLRLKETGMRQSNEISRLRTVDNKLNQLNHEIRNLNMEMVEQNKKQMVRLYVGSLFYPPTTHDRFKSGFRGTEQRVTGIYPDKNTFTSIDTMSGVEWKNSMLETHEFTWGEGKTLKHKFT